MQKDLEEQLYNETRKNLLCGGLSREIYQSLSVIRNASGYLMREIKTSVPELYTEKMNWAFDNINQSALRLNRVAENLEDMLAAERNILRPRNEWVDLVWQYRRAVELLQAGSAGYRVKIIWDSLLKENQVFVLADPDWADKILLNLLSNAVLCSESGQKVTVALTKQEYDLQLTVTDHGPGLPQAVQEHLFEAFVNQYKTQTPATGAGLGLYLAHSYCEMLGWRLSLETSENGTTARVIIPLKEVDWQQISLKSTSSMIVPDMQQRRIQAELCVWQAQKQSIKE